MYKGKIIFIIMFSLTVILLLFPQNLFAATCRSDRDCADDLFCNGFEMCDPMNPLADDRGCIIGPRPCRKSACDESLHRCYPDEYCRLNADLDGDGHASIRCGGDDCDDFDPYRFPGNVESCDAFHDEDCDPGTLGPDRDGDGYVSNTCCNPHPDGSLKCGNDCNDASMEINPEALEICNNLDDNCDGTIDEGVTVTLYPDIDKDGYGNRYVDGVPGCPGTPGFSKLGNDCDDTNAAITPGTFICNGQFGVTAVLLCTSEGAWEPRSCQTGETCVVQPNFLGLCQILPGGVVIDR